MDLDNYQSWNTFTPKVETNFEVGTDVILHVNMKGNGKLLKQKEQILWFKEGKSMAWGIPTIFPVKTERAQILRTVDSETTEYITYDKFWGVLTPLVMALYRKKIQQGFDDVAEGVLVQRFGVGLPASEVLGSGVTLDHAAASSRGNRADLTSATVGPLTTWVP